MTELGSLVMELRLAKAKLRVINAHFGYIIKHTLGASNDDPRWGRLEVHEDDKNHPVWITLGRTDDEQIYSYPIDHDLSGEDLQSFNQFGYWWHNATKELSVDDVMNDLVNAGSRLWLYAELESLQLSVDAQYRSLRPHIVVDHEKEDWGVALGDRHTDRDYLILWRNSNELWVDHEVEYPKDPIGLIPHMQTYFIDAHQNTEHYQ